MNIRQIILALALVSILAWIFFFSQEKKNVSSFEECTRYYPVMESYPRKCTSQDGQSFTEDIGNILEKENLIQIFSPLPNSIVSFPLEVTGKARGYWFFEASFPIAITDEEGKTLFETYATADGEWMTEDFVPYSTIISPEGDIPGKIFLVLKKDNPSGLPEHDDSLRIPLLTK